MKHIYYLFLTVFACNAFSCGMREGEKTSSNQNEITNESSVVICDFPEKAKDFQNVFLFPVFYDYDRGMECASLFRKKLVFVMFEAIGSRNSRDMHEKVFNDKKVSNYIKENFIAIDLLVNDRTPLLEDEWIKSPVISGGVAKKAGQKNVELQRLKTYSGSTPHFVILNSGGEPVNESISYTTKADVFLKWLKEGTKNFNAAEDSL